MCGKLENKCCVADVLGPPRPCAALIHGLCGWWMVSQRQDWYQSKRLPAKASLKGGGDKGKGNWRLSTDGIPNPTHYELDSPCKMKRHLKRAPMVS